MLHLTDYLTIHIVLIKRAKFSWVGFYVETHFIVDTGSMLTTGFYNDCALQKPLDKFLVWGEGRKKNKIKKSLHSQ